MVKGSEIQNETDLIIQNDSNFTKNDVENNQEILNRNERPIRVAAEKGILKRLQNNQI